MRASSTIFFNGGPVTYFGESAIKEMVSQQNFEDTSILVVTDANIAKTKHFIEFRSNLERNWSPHTRIEIAIIEPSEPSFQAINRQVEFLNDLDTRVFIGYGGGSVMDTTKVFRAIKDSGLSLEELLHKPPKVKKISQLVLIPTTAGTGAEMSAIAVFEHDSEKVGFSSTRLRADIVAIEPRVCSTCPRETLEGSGIDAFAHALESAISIKANFFSKVTSPVSLKLIFGALWNLLQAQFVKDHDLDNLCRGIMLSSVSYGYGGCCGVHALAYPLSSRYHIRHGKAVSLTLLPVLRYYLYKKPNLASFIRPYLHIKGFPNYPGNDTEYIIKKIDELLSYCDTIPRALSDLGVVTSELPSLAKQSQRATTLLGNSPVPIHELQAAQIYSQIK